MEENWVIYMIETEEGPASCLINIGLAEFVPDPSRPVCSLVRIPFKDPGEGGFGTEEERRAISECEDVIAGSLDESVIHFAAVTGSGAVDLWFYSDDAGAQKLGDAVREACQGYTVETGSQDDAAWERYLLLFPNDEEIARFQDSNLIRVLQENCDRIEAESRAVAGGFRVTDRTAGRSPNLPVGLQLTRSHAVDIETVTVVRERLTALAEELGGEYDGWQTALVK